MEKKGEKEKKITLVKNGEGGVKKTLPTIKD
jgi:hypothetical protein